VFVGNANNDVMVGSMLAANGDIILTGEATGDLFGHSVSNAGNVNGDARDDVIIGAPGADKAYVYYGYYLDELNYVDSNTDTDGTTTNFANAQSAADGNAYATLTEVQSDCIYNPTGRTFLGGTSDSSGAIGDMASNNGVRMVFNSYDTGTTNHDYQFVDNNASDVDSIADNGSHGEFNNEKAIDSNYDTMTEANVSGLITDFRIQRGYTIISSGQATGTITAGVDYTAPTGEAFIHIVGSRQTAMGQTSGGGTQNADDVTVFISNPDNLATSITFERHGTTNNNRLTWEIVEYIGPAGGPNEIKVREVGETNFSTTSTTNDTNTISGVVDDNDMVVYITGVANPDTGTSDYNTHICTTEWLAATDQARFTRGEAGGDAVNVSYAVVEYTGSNWTVQRVVHNFVNDGVWETENINDVGSTSKAFIVYQHLPGSGENTQEENGAQTYLFDATTVRFQLDTGVGNPNLHYGVVWVINNSCVGDGAMRVQHITGNHVSGGPEEDTWTETITAVNDTNATSIMGDCGRSNGGGTSFPRGYITMILTSETTVELKQSDSGNSQNYAFDVVQWPKSMGKRHDLDLEVQFTAVNTGKEFGEVCILTGAMDSEDLSVSYWGGSDWVSLFTDLTATSWNNASVPISSSTFTLQFKAGDVSPDYLKGTWNIDAVQLHTWNNSYEVGIEITGTSDTYSWTELEWTVDSQWSVNTVNVTLQLYNYTDAEYPGTGDGFIQYDSGAANTDELKSQTIIANPDYFKSGAGAWSVRIVGKYVGVNFSLGIDWVEVTHLSYQMDIEFTTNTVSVADPYYLELNYQSNGETFDVLVYNGATWDDMGDLSSGAMTAAKISLNTNHRLGSGDVRVRFVGQSDTSDSSQSTLYIEYHRIRSIVKGLNSSADVTFTGAANTNFGWSVANAGDVDNDNYDDVMVGAPAYDSSRGSVRLYLGGNPMDNTVDISFTGAQTGDQFGFSIACAGDLNSDGYSDLIIGAPYNDGPSGTRTDAGAVYIYLCTSDTVGTLPAEAANYIGYGKNAGDKFGWAVDKCEDINKDGEKNTVAGAPYFGTDDGLVYILYKIPEFPIILLPILIVCIIYVSNRKLKTSKKRKNR
jgi:hypothetical protein